MEYGNFIEVPFTENDLKPIPHMKIKDVRVFNNEKGIQRILLEKSGREFIISGLINYLPSDTYTTKIDNIDQNSLQKNKYDGIISFTPTVDTIMIIDSFENGKKLKSLKGNSNKEKKLEQRYYIQECTVYDNYTDWYENGQKTYTSYNGSYKVC